MLQVRPTAFIAAYHEFKKKRPGDHLPESILDLMFTESDENEYEIVIDDLLLSEYSSSVYHEGYNAALKDMKDELEKRLEDS